jgi:hypothetical protein
VSASAVSHHAGCRRAEAQAGADDRRDDTRPQRRLDLQREINPDPGAEKRRQPEQAAIAFGGEAIGKRGEDARGPRRH